MNDSCFSTFSTLGSVVDDCAARVNSTDRLNIARLFSEEDDAFVGDDDDDDDDSLCFNNALVIVRTGDAARSIIRVLLLVVLRITYRARAFYVEVSLREKQLRAQFWKKVSIRYEKRDFPRARAGRFLRRTSTTQKLDEHRHDDLSNVRRRARV